MLTVFSKCMVVDRPIVNPCMLLWTLKGGTLYICSNMLSDIIISRNLHTTEVSGTGL